MTPPCNHINISSTNSNKSYSDITTQNVETTISFSLNDRDFPQLSNVGQSILANVSGSHLHQRKVASNVEHVSVHVIPVYVSSVRELVKPLIVSSPVCSSNAAKRNVCNVSSTSKLVKSLSLSQRICSSNTTKCDVCNASSLSQHFKPLNVSKTVCSSNATEGNVCKVSSVCIRYISFHVTSI